MKKKNIIREKSFDFALNIIQLYKQLIGEKEFIISKQILRSGTSIGANIEEASAGYSRNDFIYRMSIASKEARETKYWLRLLDKSELTKLELNGYQKEIHEIDKILTSIVKTSMNRDHK